MSLAIDLLKAERAKFADWNAQDQRYLAQIGPAIHPGDNTVDRMAYRQELIDALDDAIEALENMK